MLIVQSRRRFLTNAAFVGAAGLGGFGAWDKALAAEEPPETTTIRLAKVPGTCIAPQYAAEELLLAEGFTEVRYVATGTGGGMGSTEGPAIGRGEADFSMSFVAEFIQDIDADAPIVLVAGVHVGCFELFAQHNIRSIGELKRKRVAADDPALLKLMAGQVGLDPANDFHWVTGSAVNPIELFTQGKIDAFLAFPPHGQEMRARGIGHVIVSTAEDRPWSQYFCCMLAGNREYVRKHPVATKRVLRAILKATDLCVTEPERAARRLVDRGFTPRYDYALQTLSDIPYDKWREYDPEDTLRFYALRLYENRTIKATPQQIIAENTDWRFFNELKRELKA
jgi:NitT/TauT family transport system substrate-binding protein